MGEHINARNVHRRRRNAPRNIRTLARHDIDACTSEERRVGGEVEYICQGEFLSGGRGQNDSRTENRTQCTHIARQELMFTEDHLVHVELRR
jgi:hypothetical protein